MKCYYLDVTKRHRKTLEALFSRPTRSDITYVEFESLMLFLGATKSERAGSRVAFVLRDRILHLHRPHNPSMMRKYAVEDVRDFLESLGIQP